MKCMFPAAGKFLRFGSEMVWQVQSYCPDTSVAYVVIAYPHAPRGGDAIANGHVYRGKRIPALQGTRVFGDNRGGGNGRWSSDFEDIVYVLNNRNSIWEELRLPTQQ